MAESFFADSSRARVFTGMLFLQNHKSNYGTPFKTNKKHTLMGQSFFEIHFVDLLFQSLLGMLDSTHQKLRDQIVAFMSV